MERHGRGTFGGIVRTNPGWGRIRRQGRRHRPIRSRPGPQGRRLARPFAKPRRPVLCRPRLEAGRRRVPPQPPGGGHQPDRERRHARRASGGRSRRGVHLSGPDAQSLCAAGGERRREPGQDPVSAARRLLRSFQPGNLERRYGRYGALSRQRSRALHRSRRCAHWPWRRAHPQFRRREPLRRHLSGVRRRRPLRPAQHHAHPDRRLRGLGSAEPNAPLGGDVQPPGPGRRL